MPTETLAASVFGARAALVARGPAGCAGRRGLPGLPRLGRVLGQARAARRGRGDRHGRPQPLARGPDPGASAAGEAAVAAVVDRRADDAHRPPRRVDRPASRRARGRGDGRARLCPGPADGGPRAGTGLGLRPLFARGSSWARCARPATTVCSCCSPPWLSMRPGAGSHDEDRRSTCRRSAKVAHRLDLAGRAAWDLVFYARSGWGS